MKCIDLIAQIFENFQLIQYVTIVKNSMAYHCKSIIRKTLHKRHRPCKSCLQERLNSILEHILYPNTFNCFITFIADQLDSK